MLNAPTYSYINNLKLMKHKDSTFSGYKKTHVLQELKKNILKGNTDKACFWACELDVSGFTEEVWNKMLIFACKEINSANPNLPNYLYERYLEFSTLQNTWSNIEIRNSQESRNRLCELICVLSLSPKNKMPNYTKIKESDFQIYNMKRRMIAPNQDFIQDIVHSNNTIEIKIALNEFANYLLLNNRGSDIIHNTFFWLDWITYYNKLYKSLYGKELECIELYSHTDIDPKYKANFIWYVWDIIFAVLHEKKYTRHKHYNTLKTCTENLYNLYTLKLSKGNMNSRSIYVKYAILLLLDTHSTIRYDKDIFNKIDIQTLACANINNLYKQIKDNQKGYEYKIKEHCLKHKIKNINSKEELFDIEEKNIHTMEVDKLIGKYMQNLKFGKDKFRDELIRKQEYEKYYQQLQKQEQNRHFSNNFVQKGGKQTEQEIRQQIENRRNLQKKQEHIQRLNYLKHRNKLKYRQNKQTTQNRRFIIQKLLNKNK